MWPELVRPGPGAYSPGCGAALWPLHPVHPASSGSDSPDRAGCGASAMPQRALLQSVPPVGGPETKWNSHRPHPPCGISLHRRLQPRRPLQRLEGALRRLRPDHSRDYLPSGKPDSGRLAASPGDLRRVEPVDCGGLLPLDCPARRSLLRPVRNPRHRHCQRHRHHRLSPPAAGGGRSAPGAVHSPGRKSRPLCRSRLFPGKGV